MNVEGLAELLNEQEKEYKPVPSKLPLQCPCGKHVGYWYRVGGTLALCKECQERPGYKYHLDMRASYIRELQRALADAEKVSVYAAQFELEEGVIVVPAPTGYHNLDRAAERVQTSFVMLSKK